MTAILVLCSAAGAAPLRRPGWNNDYSSGLVSVIGSDLGFNVGAVEKFQADQPEIPLVTTSLGSAVTLHAQDLARRGPASTGTPASEPPPVATIALGFAFIGAAALIRRTRTERRRARRRALVRIRAIIASR